MRNFYYFNDDINVETVNNLLDKLSGFEDKIDLYFSTYGGEMSPMDFLVKCLNTFGERLTVTLTDTVMSAGVKILTDYTGHYCGCTIKDLSGWSYYRFLLYVG